MRSHAWAALLLPLAIASLPVYATSPSKVVNPWSQFKGPKLGKAEVIGGYTAGCLVGAQQMPIIGAHHRMMRPARKRYFAHPELASLLLQIAAELHQTDKRLMLIGDLSQARGGPTMSQHQSHQNGLDADIWYLRARAGKALAANKLDSFAALDIVDGKRQRLKKNAWTPEVQTLLRKLGQEPRIERLLVNPVIKQELCKSETGDRRWLAKVRPWWGHSAHVHVRMACPKDSSDCQAQDKTPEDPGCDETLAWWFGEEAKAEFLKLKERMDNPVMPILPDRCKTLLAP